jgi:uncharacterized protein (TIGR02996 family)
VDIEAALLAAIRETPDDDTPRLALGDWLMEQPEAVQQARGELIHLQCRLARLPGYDPERPALEAREKALREEHTEAWLDGLSAFVHPGAWMFERGMLGLSLHGPQVWVSPEDLAWLADWQWVDRIALRDFEDVPEDWLSSPALSGITSLDCSGEAARTVIGVLARGGLRGVRALGVLNCPLTDGEVETLANSPAMSRLRRLSLCGTDVTSSGLASLTRSARAIGLRALEVITWLPFDGEGAVAFASSPHLSELTSLKLASLHDVGSEWIRSLVSHLRHLQKLSLNRCGIGPEAIQALTRSHALSRLTSLELVGEAIGERGARLLASSPSLCRLTELSLIACGINAAGATALAQSSNLQHLRLLSLQCNPLYATGVKALAASPYLQQLQSLNLGRTDCNDAGVVALASSPFLTNLTDLDLSLNDFDRRGAAALASSAFLHRLHKLDRIGTLLPPNEQEALRARFGDALR